MFLERKVAQQGGGAERLGGGGGGGNTYTTFNQLISYAGQNSKIAQDSHPRCILYTVPLTQTLIIKVLLQKDFEDMIKVLSQLIFR